MRLAYHATSALAAQARSKSWPPSSTRPIPMPPPASVTMAETLIVLRLGCPHLARTLRTTNAVESMIAISRDHARNVKRWRDGQMALRWCAAGMVEAGKQFRRVNGHLHLPALRTALRRHVGPTTVTNQCHDHHATAA